MIGRDDTGGAVVWAVVVARVGHGAKSRLADWLSAEQRRALALAMLADVLAVCDSARHGVGDGPPNLSRFLRHGGRRGLLGGVVAVVDDPSAREVAEAAGALAVDDGRPGDMNAAVRAGVQAARQRGAKAVIVLPGDVPLLTRDDLVALLEAAGDAPHAVVVGASRDGQGTNALLLRPPEVIAPAFGPPSVERHLRLGRAAGALAQVRHALSLAFDVDTPADLAALTEAPARGRQTARVLETLPRPTALRA